MHDLLTLIRLAWHDNGPSFSVFASLTSASGAIIWSDEFWIQWMGVPMPVVLAAFAGAACALSFQQRMGVIKSLCAVLVSTLIPAYAAPLAAWSLNVPGNLTLGLTALLALFAQSLIGFTFLTLPKMLPEVIKNLVDAIVERIKGSRR